MEQKTSQVGVLWNAGNPVKELDFKETESAAQALKLKVHSLGVKTPDDFSAALKTRRRIV